jgi:hypothetical protein
VQDGSAHQMATALAEGFVNMPRLECVRLYSCNMSSGGARAVAATLACCSGVTNLDLNRAFWDEQVPTSPA